MTTEICTGQTFKAIRLFVEGSFAEDPPPFATIGSKIDITLCAAPSSLEITNNELAAVPVLWGLDLVESSMKFNWAADESVTTPIATQASSLSSQNSEEKIDCSDRTVLFRQFQAFSDKDIKQWQKMRHILDNLTPLKAFNKIARSVKFSLILSVLSMKYCDIKPFRSIEDIWRGLVKINKGSSRWVNHMPDMKMENEADVDAETACPSECSLRTISSIHIKEGDTLKPIHCLLTGDDERLIIKTIQSCTGLSNYDTFFCYKSDSIDKLLINSPGVIVVNLNSITLTQQKSLSRYLLNSFIMHKGQHVRINCSVWAYYITDDGKPLWANTNLLHQFDIIFDMSHEALFSSHQNFSGEQLYADYIDEVVYADCISLQQRNHNYECFKFAKIGNQNGIHLLTTSLNISFNENAKSLLQDYIVLMSKTTQLTSLSTKSLVKISVASAMFFAREVVQVFDVTIALKIFEQSRGETDDHSWSIFYKDLNTSDKWTMESEAFHTIGRRVEQFVQATLHK